MVPLINMFMIGSVYIIICMTVNKFIAIYKPLIFQRIHTLKNAKLCISLSIISSILFHIPCCFMKTVVFNGSCSTSPSNTSTRLDLSVNETGVACGWQSAINNDVADASAFKVYVVILQIFSRVVPIVVLAVLNSLIVHKYRVIVKELEVPRASLRPVSAATPTPGSSPLRCPMQQWRGQ